MNVLMRIDHALIIDEFPDATFKAAGKAAKSEPVPGQTQKVSTIL